MEKDIREIIKEMEEQSDFFQSVSGQYFICTKEADSGARNNMYLVDSEDFIYFFMKYADEKYGVIFGRNQCRFAQDHFKMLAWKTKEKREIYARTICRKKSIYYDLDGRKIIKISAEEIKYISLKKPLFYQNVTFAPQTEPDLGTESFQVAEYVKKHFHLKTDTDRILLSVFIISCFWGRAVAHPILQIYGEKGSAKSTALRRIQDLVDPKRIDIGTMPRKNEEVALVLSSQYLTCFDNVSYIPASVSDILCRNCTGSSETGRKMFTNKELSIVELKSVVCINGTCQNVVRSDLADRTIFLELERLKETERRTEQELENEWKKDRPGFFGALLKAVQGVLKDTETKIKRYPIRLADFYEIAVKAGIQAGYSRESVEEAFKENQERMSDAVTVENVVVMAVSAFMEDYEFWEGGITEFFLAVKEYAIEYLGISVYYFPKAANHFMKQLNMNRSDLEYLGITYQCIKRKERIIRLKNSR